MKNETKFTPGPWEIARYQNHIGYSIWAKDAGCIAERWYPSEKENAPIAENAHLIAAAPDLFEALKNLLADIVNYQTINNLGGENNACQVAARAALAKALLK
jgi:hypothetical protein